MGQLASLRDITGMVRRRMLLIALILLVGVPLAVLFALSRPQMYEATAVIQIEAPQVAEVLIAGTTTGNSTQNRLDLIEQKLMSRDSLVAMIDRFDLFPPDMPLIERIAALRQSVRIVKLVDPAQSWRPDVQPSGLAITVRLDDAQKAAGVANAFLDDILTEARQRSEGRAARTLAFFVDEEARVSTTIATLEADFARFKEANAAALPAGIDAQRTQLSRLTDALIAIEQDIIGLQTNRDRLRAEEIARQTDLLQQQRALIAQNIATIQRALDAAPEVERQFNAFTRQLEQLQEEYRIVTARRTEAAMTQLLESQDQSERFEVLETALVPEAPVSASRKKVAAAGAVAVGLVALGAALMIEWLHPAIRTAAQLERALGVQAVVVIPNLRAPAQARRRLGLVALILAALALILSTARGWATALGGILPFQQRAAVPVAVTRPRQ